MRADINELASTLDRGIFFRRRMSRRFGLRARRSIKSSVRAGTSAAPGVAREVAGNLVKDPNGGRRPHPITIRTRQQALKGKFCSNDHSADAPPYGSVLFTYDINDETI